MEAAWRRLEAALPERARATLGQGLSEGSRSAVEAGLGQRLPDELRASLGLHDGSGPLLDGAALLTLGQGVRLRAAYLKEPELWPASWLPITTRGTGEHHVVDLRDGSLHLHGRGPPRPNLVWSDYWVHLGDEPRYDVEHDGWVTQVLKAGGGHDFQEVAPATPASLRALLEGAAAALEGGAWVDDEALGVVDARWRRAVTGSDFGEAPARDLAKRRVTLRTRAKAGLKSLAKSKKELSPGHVLTRGYAGAAAGKPAEAIEDLERYVEARSARVSFSMDGTTTEKVVRPPEYPGIQTLLAALRHAPELAALPAASGR